MSTATFLAGVTAGFGVSVTFLLFLVMLNLRARRRKHAAYVRMFEDVEKELRRYPPVPMADERQHIWH